MTSNRFFWAVAASGMRVASGLTLILLAGLFGSLLGWIEGDPVLTIPLIAPIAIVLVFENVWLTGRLTPRSYARAGGVISLLALSAVAAQLAAFGITGLIVTLFAILAFAGVIALTALIHPVAEGF